VIQRIDPNRRKNKILFPTGYKNKKAGATDWSIRKESLGTPDVDRNVQDRKIRSFQYTDNV